MQGRRLSIVYCLCDILYRNYCVCVSWWS